MNDPTMELPLACPRCAQRYEVSERFCADCGMPLTYAGRVNAEQQDVSESQARARKIRPQYSRGALVKVAVGRQLAEAEFIQMLLLDEGIPSTLRRTAGFDVPDMLAAGPRDVLVPESGVETAHQVLLDSELVSHPNPAASSAAPPPGVLLAGILVALGIVALLVWLALGAS
jgi:transposase